MKRALLLFIPWCLALAQSGITPPRVGWLLDRAGHPRPLEGIAGSFWLGKPLDDAAISLNSSGATTLLKTETEIIVLDRGGRVTSKIPAPEGPARFAFNASGSPALAWFSQTGELDRFLGSRLQRVPVDASILGGDVIALAQSSPLRATLLIERDHSLSRVSVNLRSGLVQFETSLPGLRAPAYLDAGGTILAVDENGVLARRANGAETHLSLVGEPAEFTPLGNGWILARYAAPGHPYAIRIASLREQVFQLPEPQKQ